MPTSRAALSVTALTLFLTSPGSTATAASGIFTYTPPPESHIVTDPAYGCRTSPGGIGVDNLTNQEVQLFPSPNCSGIPVKVAPDTGKDDISFGSVLVVRQASGTLVYATRSAPETLTDPSSGRCENVTGDGLVLNRTNATALLYSLTGCPGTPTHAVDPHGHTSAVFRSVKFVD
ncbi:hypothetical protein [Streptomyces sp. NPDC091212]|uniref:hypothetical protein n=1 Tax=Streptomyces sp. NPDC091212 TaxID=3155191 RepID=UPI0034322FC7